MLEDNLDVFPEAILGWRCWVTAPLWEYLVPQAPQEPLVALTNNTYWKPGINHAVCNKTTDIVAAENDFENRFEILNLKAHPSPGETCHCGFNAYHGAEELLDSTYVNETEVIGTIAGAGDVQIHRDGWRSEYAKTIALYDPDGDTENSRSIQSIGIYYGIPVFLDIEEMQRYSLTQARSIPASYRKNLI